MYDLEKLLEFLREDEECDKEDFAKKRSAVLLIAGEHYARKNSLFQKRLRDVKDLSQEQKLRITKNHIQKIVRMYANTIMSSNPGVGFVPKNESELQDQKAAELHKSVWLDAVQRYDIDALQEEWCDDFTGLGEVAVKIFWDQNIGDLVGYHQKIDDNGRPMFDEAGQPLPGAPAYSGGFVFESIYAFNLLRDRNAKKMVDASRMTIRKSVNVKDLQAKFPDKADKIKESMDKTYTVFEASKGGYIKADGQVMLYETYFKPNSEHPNGYYCFYTEDVKLISGELPGGIFPIVWEGMNTIQTTPRGVGPVETMRPYQAEINRASSKMAEQQITLGDDKIILNNGSKVSAGIAMPGVRAIHVTGGDPTILSGRDGGQYANTILSNIDELYKIMDVYEPEDSQIGKMDPLAMLFRSGSAKKKFSRYTRRYERFLCNVCRTYLRLAKIYLPDDAIIRAIGRSEQVNIAEFKNMNELAFEIKVEPQSEDIDSLMGKHIMLTNVLQYVGGKLERDDIGKLLRLMPFGNNEKSFSDLTLDYDSATNNILALDRGERPPVDENDNHEYMIKRLRARTRESDYKFLPDQVKEGYEIAIQLHRAHQAENIQRVKRMESDLIPTGGYLVTCDFYMADPKDETKTKRAKLPYEAIAWLVKALEVQGATQERLDHMDASLKAEIAQEYLSNQGAVGGQGSALPAPVQ